MSRMRSSQLSYAPGKCRILAEWPDPHNPMTQYGQQSTAPTLRSRIVAVPHGLEDHVRTGNHVLTARNKVAHRRAARALAHGHDVLEYELVESFWIGAALALVRRKGGDHLHATGFGGQHVFLTPGVEVDRNVRRRECDRHHDEQKDLAYACLTIFRVHPLSSLAN